ncbi:hypothetical protein HPB47_020088 [Ixodes persulcatus]|uniref:Uncharacterized protein n=1 Tax=Ixodes persulcatus TaxID=34615 RepID=A0AC60QG96_IXOPE|nr:hypothetical protein HPB47_020088 [Ixodes persulcatus]
MGTTNTITQRSADMTECGVSIRLEFVFSVDELYAVGHNKKEQEGSFNKSNQQPASSIHDSPPVPDGRHSQVQSRGVFASETFRQRPEQSIARRLEAGGRKTAFLFRRLNSKTRCATRQTRDRTRAPETERLLRDDLLRKTNAPAGFVRRGKPEAELPATCCASRCNGDACQLAYCQHKTWHRDARNNDK